MSILFIGSGPHNLTALTFLLQGRPELKGEVRVLDPSGAWLKRWNAQMRAQEIVHLRSSSVHHPDPDPLALRRFAKGRYDEFYPPYFLPGTELFGQFCADVIDRFDVGSLPEEARVLRLEAREGRLTAHLSGTEDCAQGVLSPRHVVVSLGGGERRYPEFYQKWLEGSGAFRLAGETPPLLHSEEVDLTELGEGVGRTVLIVGAGLTAGHLALGALKRGWKVALLARRRITYKLFDSAPGWIGPKHLAGFLREKRWERRRRMIAKARGGGAMTEELRQQLAPFLAGGQLKLKPRCEVRSLSVVDDRWRADCGWGRFLLADQVWMCTGSKLDLKTHPLFRDLWKTHPLQLYDGLPVLDSGCRWPGLPLYLLGLPAGLSVGPTARNFPGARKAASLVAEAIGGVRVGPT
ncbi:MAG: FAD/NAD(P)-binding protein [Spirochaetales bacterium]